MLTLAPVVATAAAVILVVAVVVIVAASAVVAAAPAAGVPRVWATLVGAQKCKLDSITRLSQDMLDEVQSDVVNRWLRVL